MDGEILNIYRMLKRSFKKNAWHGPAVLEALENITPDETVKRIGNGHSIIELVAHMTAWRTYIIRKLSGDDGYEVSAEQNFPTVTDWPAVLDGLIKSQEELVVLIEKFPESSLKEIVHGRQYDFYTMLHGIIQHDIYHVGQIVMIRKHP